MTPFRACQRGWLVWGCLLVNGCAVSAPSPMAYSVRHLSATDQGAALESARAVLDDAGYRIVQADPIAGVYAAKSIRETEHRPSSGSTIRLSSAARMRRAARVRVTETAGTINVYCQVTVQEQLTETHRILRQDLVTSDLPGRTAIEREGATTVEQNTVWQTLRRDRAAERRILEAVVKQLGGST